MNSPLSEFDYMLKVRLPNWGRWGRQDDCRPDPEAGSASIYSMGRADRQGEDEAPTDATPQIDHADAERLDRLIGNQIAREYRHVLCGYFYKRRGDFWPRVHAAVRALIDAEEAAMGKVA